MRVVLGVDLCLSPAKKKKKKRVSFLPQNSGRILCLNDGTLFRTTSITAFKLMTCNCWFVGFEKKTHKKNASCFALF